MQWTSMFLSIGAIRFLYASLQRMGQRQARKNGRCPCPDIAGRQLELEEQVRLPELLLCCLTPPFRGRRCATDDSGKIASPDVPRTTIDGLYSLRSPPVLLLV